MNFDSFILMCKDQNEILYYLKSNLFESELQRPTKKVNIGQKYWQAKMLSLEKAVFKPQSLKAFLQ